MMNCPRCQNDIQQQDKYCQGCGLPLEEPRASISTKKPEVKRNYEEASTQLVDVEEFRKYLEDREKQGSQAQQSSMNTAAGQSLSQGLKVTSSNSNTNDQNAIGSSVNSNFDKFKQTTPINYGDLSASSKPPPSAPNLRYDSNSHDSMQKMHQHQQNNLSKQTDSNHNVFSSFSASASNSSFVGSNKTKIAVGAVVVIILIVLGIVLR